MTRSGFAFPQPPRQARRGAHIPLPPRSAAHIPHPPRGNALREASLAGLLALAAAWTLAELAIALGLG